MKKSKLLFWVLPLLLCGPTAHAGPRTPTEYKLEWNYEGLPFEVRTARAPLSESSRVSETGVVSDQVKLPIQSQMPDGKVKISDSESAVIYLFVKNNGKKKIRFSVAPHSTHPGASALGFSFNCLCNGHIYEVPPGKIWYRIMELKARGPGGKESVQLMHHIFEVK